MPGVVRTHRQLVDQQLAVDGLEQLDGQHTDDAEFVRQPQGQLLSRGTDVAGQLRGRRDHRHADAVALHRLDHRPGRALPERRARHQRRELATHRDPLLDQYRYAGI